MAVVGEHEEIGALELTDIQFIRLNEKWFLAHNKFQWIIQKRGSFDKRNGQWRWCGVKFVAGTKLTLLRTLSKLDIELEPAAEGQLGDLPDTFRDWSIGLEGNGPARI